MKDISERIGIISSFFKVSPDYKVLKNEEYELQSVDGKRSGITYDKEENGRFNINTIDKELITNGAYNLIPDVILDDIMRVETREDIRTIFGNDDFFRITTPSHLPFDYLEFYVPIVIKQTVAEPGYGKHDIIIPMYSWISFYYNNAGEITNLEFLLSINPETYCYGDAPALNTVGDFKSLQYTTLNELVDGACMNTNMGTIITEGECTDFDAFGTGVYYIVPFFVETDGEVTLTIENKVNGLAKYNAYKDKDLEYTIFVKNTSSVVSTSNQIVTHVPTEVSVKEDEISNNGVYNENTITWNIEKIDAGETIELSYKATVSENIDGEELVGYSTVTSTQVLGAVYSNNTIVTMNNIVESQENPLTNSKVYLGNTNIGLPLSYLIVFLVVICFLAVVFVKRIKYLKK